MTLQPIVVYALHKDCPSHFCMLFQLFSDVENQMSLGKEIFFSNLHRGTLEVSSGPVQVGL